MLSEKIIVPTTPDRVRLDSFGIEDRHQDAFARISDILRPHAVELSTKFMNHFLALAGFEMDDAARQAQIDKTAEYSKNKYTPPINGDWIRRIEKMGAVQHRAGAPIYANLASLNLSHRTSVDLINAHAKDIEEARYLTNQFMRVAALEAEIMVSTVQRLEQESFNAEKNRNVETFEATVAQIIEKSGGQSAAAKQKSAQVADAADMLLALASEVAAASSQSTSAMTDAARMSGGLNHTIELIDSELRSAFDSFSELTVTAEEAMESANQLTEHSNSIERVVKLIREIADQTSILALNALIEAAQAGNAGAGFAVVANEMKALASQTESATQDIADQLSGISASTSQSVTAHHSIASRFDQLRAIAGKLQSSLGEQASSVTAIAACIDETAQSAEATAEAVAEISRRAGHVSRDVGEVSDSVTELDGSLQSLQRSADSFATEMKS